MKFLFRILIVLFTVVFVYYSYFAEYEKREENLISSKVIQKEDIPETLEKVLPRPQKGLSTFIDLESTHLLEKFGEPNRIDQTPFEYDWWVYNSEPALFVMFGIKNGIVTQVYVSGNSLDVTPYKIGQTVDEVYRMTIVESEVTVQLDDILYTFAMNEEDLKNRILTQFDGIYTQLYIDEKEGVLYSVRFLNGEALVENRPYEMSPFKNVNNPAHLNSNLLEQSNSGYSNQLFDLINILRTQNNLSILKYSKSLSTVAMNHSEDMYINNYVLHDSPKLGALKQYLDEKSIQYKEVEGNLENPNFDAVEAVHRWLNSEKNREVLLNELYTHAGSGVFNDYYTQIFTNKQIEPKEEDIQ